MEGVAALTLACSAVQLVDFSLKITEKCRDIYKAGNTSQNGALHDDAEEISQLAKSLEKTLQLGAVDQRSGPQPQKLHSCAKKCIDAAQDLENLLRTLTAGPGQKRDALRMSVRTMWKKDKIDELQRRLEVQQATLNTSILVDLRDLCIANKMQMSNSFNQLDTHVQNLAVALTNNIASVTEIASFLRLELEKKIQADGSVTRAHIDAVGTNMTRGFGQLRDNLKDSHASKILRSLAFPEMNSRREDVSDAHARTFRWIFGLPDPERDNREAGPSEPRKRPRRKNLFDDFVEWLQTGAGCYWINGKAGSGKSTLMNFIYEAEECHEHLNTWANGARFMRPSFFFWNPGTEIQKSTIGLFRALIYQILDSDRSLTSQVESTLDSHQVLSLDQDGHPQIVWSEKKLRLALQNVLVECQRRDDRLCFFIDGLDEFDGERLGLLAWISEMAQFSHVKLCISSRPWALFAEAFASSPQLKLQDLTRHDIQKYIKEEFMNRVMARYPMWQADLVQDLVDEIEYRADGIFLWVKLVVRNLLEALPKGDSLSDLRDRLRDTPRELEALYQHMIDNHIDRAHRTKAFEYFKLLMCRHSKGADLLTLALATWERLQASSVEGLSALDCKAGLEYAASARDHISVRTAGLLELSSFEGEDPSQREIIESAASLSGQDSYAAQHIASLRSRRLSFIHRSFFEFLSVSSRIPDSDKPLQLELLLKASVVTLNWLVIPAHQDCRAFSLCPSTIADLFREVERAGMRNARRLQKYHQTVPVDLLDLFGDILAKSHTDPWIMCYLQRDLPVVDFPGWATKCGLTAYAYQKLLAHPATEQKGYAEYLLCCLNYQNPLVSSLNELLCFIEALLVTKKADPNGSVVYSSQDMDDEEVTLEITPWSCILEAFRWASSAFYRVEDFVPNLAQAMFLFVESGANVSSDQCGTSHFVKDQADSFSIRLYCQLSLTAYLGISSLRELPNVPSLRKALFQRNAPVICKPESLEIRFDGGRSRRIPANKLDWLVDPLRSYVLSGENKDLDEELTSVVHELLNDPEHELWDDSDFKSQRRPIQRRRSQTRINPSFEG